MNEINRIEGPAPKDQEPTPRHLRIGIMGPIGAGKTTLARSLGERWGVTPKEEKYRDNPFLGPFYGHPELYSFKSQRFFIEDSIGQASSADPSSTEISDPAHEMHLTYALTQHKMGWMSIAEWETYKNLYRTLKLSKGIHFPDLFISVNAQTSVLIERIEKRLGEDKNREHEKWILEHLNYLDELGRNVDEWVEAMKSKVPVFCISSEGYDFSGNGRDKEVTLARIEGFIAVELDKNPIAKTGERLIAPSFAPIEPRGVDIIPGLSAEARRTYRG